MKTFIDTSAFLAVLNAQDRFHPAARACWEQLLSDGAGLLTSNYVLLETTALLQSRFGIEALRLFDASVLPVLDVLWVDESLHRQAMSALLAANRRALSLVDCASFELLRRSGVEQVFTFDAYFGEQGFRVIPAV